MKHRVPWALTVVIAATMLTGCAGGWRHGAPPGEAGSSAAPAAKAVAPSARTSAPASAAGDVAFVYRGDGASVALAGDFNNWSTSADPMVKQADGTWKLTKKLEPGKHPYKFVIDGGTWKEDPNAAEFVDDGFGGKNSIVVVGAGAAGAGSASASPGDDAAGGAVATGKAKPPEILGEGVRFTFAGAGRAVHLSGEFNAWSTTTDPMTLEGGVWTITKKLASGTYQYKFLIDGKTWKTDAANPESTDDGFGGKNSVVTIP